MEFVDLKYGEVCCECEELPFCCGVVVLGGARGSLNAFSGLLKREGHEGDSGLLLYTLIPEQKEEKAQITKAGFKKLVSFRNPRTGNTVTLYGKKINQRKKR
jgi:hypothetical protein